MGAKVGFWLSLKTWVKPKYNRVIVCIKRNNDSLFAIMGNRIGEEVCAEPYQITHLH